MTYPPNRPWPRWYKPACHRGILPNHVILAVASDFGLTFSEVTGRGQQRAVVHARAVVAKILRARGMSCPRIGHFIGGRDHSTIMNLIDMFPVYERMNASVRQSYGVRRVEFAS